MYKAYIHWLIAAQFARRTINSLLIHFCTLCFDSFVMNIFVVGHELIDCAIGCKFDDAVSHSLDEFMVVTREKDIALELREVVVKRLNTLQVLVVSGGV